MATSWLATIDVEAVLGALLWDEDHILDAAVEVPTEVVIPNARGAILTLPNRVAVRDFALKYTFDGVSRAAVRTNLEKMKALVGNGEDISVRVADMTDLSITARCVDLKAVNQAPHQVSIPIDVEIFFRAANPYWQSTTPESVSFGATPVAMPQGTAPSEPVYTSPIGPLAACTLRGYTHLDVEDWFSTLAALGSGEQYRITTTRGVMLIEKFTGGVWVASDASLTAGIFPRLLPSKGVAFQTSAWPKASASAGTWVADYPRQWR